ncbi:MAG: hypothetical protein MT490_08450 [Sphingomonas sp.]|uniref:hypothetical protein n=1 Tax=Sphingomonas sp. TaxID=28214 RepID=UPI0022731CDF|nr:hypothetical protein [Sphingomonas sp.]MCX8475812.1 hypothetical protein [Sphingomonas sp.]
MNKLLLSALASLTLASPAIAGDKHPVFVETKAVKDKPVVALDPAKAYVMLRTDEAVPLYLMRMPTADEQAVYAELRSKALAEARGKYAKKRANYDRAVTAAAKLPKGSPAPRIPDEPIEPTEANFEFTPFGAMAAVGIGPLDRFAKAKGGASTYLQELTPGEYRIYGHLVIGPNAALGSCFCMGSVKFEARAGEIVDMGVILTDGIARPKATPGDSSMPVVMDIPNYLGPAPAEMTLDPRLAQMTVRRAEYRPVGKLPNYFGVTIGRIPEMAGVFRYERDRIVDLAGTN